MKRTLTSKRERESDRERYSAWKKNNNNRSCVYGSYVGSRRESSTCSWGRLHNMYYYYFISEITIKHWTFEFELRRRKKKTTATATMKMRCVTKNSSNGSNDWLSPFERNINENIWNIFILCFTPGVYVETERRITRTGKKHLSERRKEWNSFLYIYTENSFVARRHTRWRPESEIDSIFRRTLAKTRHDKTSVVCYTSHTAHTQHAHRWNVLMSAYLQWKFCCAVAVKCPGRAYLLSKLFIYLLRRMANIHLLKADIERGHPFWPMDLALTQPEW